MSRLDSFIRRLQAQRACLDMITAELTAADGPVIELGLGNGRTYDHLRERVAPREVFVFERSPDPHPLSRPDDAHLVVGDLDETLPQAMTRLLSPAVLAHSDIGTGDAERNACVARTIAELLPPLLIDGALIASDQRLISTHLKPVELPANVDRNRYFIYRHDHAA